MSTKRAVFLERVLPAFDPISSNRELTPLVSLPTPDPLREPSQEEEESEDEESYCDDWSHAAPELIEQRVRAYNEEIGTHEIEIYFANDPYTRMRLRQKIMNCMDARDDLIVEHTRFYPERAHLLEAARRSRAAQNPDRVRRAYEECVANHPAEGQSYREGIKQPRRTRGRSTTAKTQRRTKQRKKRKTSPISVKVDGKQKSFVFSFTHRC
jgi:hypothetical protein